mmetsp:Transcript_57588/g.106433  ORF Transcript_57588/g.106433 Transcript_57588/m.106433 type:complete len:260 (+) Transcript_57588:117-896(+)
MQRGGGTRFYVSELLPECEDEDLEDYFGKYGQVLEASVVKDRETNLSRCFGFVRMANPALIGVLQGDHQLWDSTFTCKASEKAPETSLGYVDPSMPPSAYGQGADSRFFVGHLPDGITEDDLFRHFSKFGEITEVTIVKGKPFGFVKFNTASPELTRVMLDERHELLGKRVEVKREFKGKSRGRGKDGKDGKDMLPPYGKGYEYSKGAYGKDPWGQPAYGKDPKGPYGKGGPPDYRGDGKGKGYKGPPFGGGPYGGKGM